MSLPLKYKLSLREHWESPDAPAAKALQSLKDVLGVRVICNPEWPIIATELRCPYEERGVDLIASLTGLIRSLSEAVTELADDEAWADALWDKLGEAPRALKIYPEVYPRPLEKPRARWDDQREGIVLDIPKAPIATPLEFIPAIKEDVRTAFEPRSASVEGGTFEMVEPEPTRAPPKDLPIHAPPARAQPAVQYLPDPSALPRPDELLQDPPYHMIIRHLGEVRIDVECTHSPSLEVLATYLKRWARTDHQLSTKPPAVNISLQQGSFGAGIMHDVLTLQTGDDKGRFHISPTLILHLVERVLGYERVDAEMHRWHYLRTEPFKRV